MRKEEDKEVQYIWHNNATIREDQLISQALNARSYEEAKSFIMSLMAHGLMHGINTYIYKVNDILEHHHVAPYPVPHAMDSESDHRQYQKSPDDMAREKYQQLDKAAQHAILQNGLYVLADKHQKLINKKGVWIGLFHVIHDRLDGTVAKTNFTQLAQTIEPSNWPKKYSISPSTMANYSHHISYEDSLEAYYDMENNPFKELCDTFWDVLTSVILTSVYE